jgi:hypothetical protein
MGPGEAISLLGVCALLIALVAMTFATYSRRLAFKQRKLELETQVRMGAPASSELVARLEKRVRVLERLATERGPDVAAQIEALREDRALAGLSEVPAK